MIARIFILKMHVDRSFQCHFTVHHVDFARKVDRFILLQVASSHPLRGRVGAICNYFISFAITRSTPIACNATSV